MSLPPQREGELGVLAAKSGMGKTTVLLDWAHDFAHEQGFDVLFVYMETLTESMFDRWVSRHTWVQVKDLVDPKRGFNLRGDKPKEKIAWAKFTSMTENYKRCQKEKGRIFFCYAPDVSATEFEAQVAQYKAMSSAAGRGLVVIVDYYSLLGVGGLEVSAKAEDWRQNDARASFFKRIAKRYRVYMWVAAQDNMNAKYTDNERKTPKNGSVIFEQAQIVVRIMRAYAKENLAMCDSKGQQHIDNAGRPVYWELKDQPSSLGALMVEKVSDGETGGVHVKFNPAYYRIDLNESKPKQPGEVAQHKRGSVA